MLQIPFPTYSTNANSNTYGGLGAGLPPSPLPLQTRSLYVGNLAPQLTDQLLYEIFSTIGPLEGCKVIKDKNTGYSAGYGFVDFYDPTAASYALNSMNGRKIYGYEIKVNWASAGQKEDTSTHYHIFVGDLSPEIDDQALHNAFLPFGSISDARVMRDPNTNRSRGYGFVAFRRKEDAERAMSEMNGEWLGGRPIRCNWANQKSKLPDTGDYISVSNQTSQLNTTVYIGNLAPETSEAILRTIFQDYGTIEEIKMQTDKGFGFVRYTQHDSAARAIVAINGRMICSKAVRCSWGKEPSPSIFANIPTGVPHPAINTAYTQNTVYTPYYSQPSYYPPGTYGPY